MIERLFGNGKEWEKPNGNSMGMGIDDKIGNGDGKEWETTCMGMGENGNVKSHFRSSLT